MRIVISLLILCFTGQLFALDLTLPGKTTKLEDLVSSSSWERLDLPTKRTAAPYLIDYGLSNGSSSQKRILQILGKEKSDGTLFGYYSVASVYYGTPKTSSRIDGLLRLRNSSSAPEYKRILDFHILMQRFIVGDTTSGLQLSSNCVPAEICSFSQLIREVELIHAQKEILHTHLKTIVVLLRPFIDRDGSPPFFLMLGGNLPDRLASIGLPLEGATLADRIVTNDLSATAKELRLRIPIYLAMSGDFRSAYRYSNALTDKPDFDMRRLWMDWLVLSGQYSEAAEYLSNLGPENLTNDQKGYDLFSERRPNAEEYRIRLAMLLYLGGDKKGAVRALEQISQSKAMIGNEPVAYTARLRIAQISLADNPQLAQKIAEDISYIATENDWYLLEYRATILNGWAQYYLKNDFAAMVSFIKARGILSAQQRDYNLEYSRLLGILLIRLRAKPAQDQSQMFSQIFATQPPWQFGTSYHILKEWLPPEVGFETSIQELVTSLYRRGRRWEALNVLAAHQELKESLFGVGHNPGGVRGLFTSLAWSSLPIYMRNYERVRMHPSVLGWYARHRPAWGYANAPWRIAYDDKVLLSYPLGESVFFATISRLPRNRGNFVTISEVEKKEVIELQKECNYENNGDCVFKSEALNQVKASLAGSGVRIQYDSRLELNFEKAFNLAEPPVYFMGGPLRKQVDAKYSYFPDGCSSLPTMPKESQPRKRVSDIFAGPASGDGIWFFPSELDPPKSSNGKIRPVYLRKFLCGENQWALWDMDRYDSGPSPDLVVFHHRKQEFRLNQAFARHFTEKGTWLLEIYDSWSREASDQWFEEIRKDSSEKGLARALAKLKQSNPNTKVRLIVSDPNFK